ncbi:MAG: MFS transporter [Anaerolineae bacterium]|nr:MAG: MFS transporter [Anaerolineae bacterium]
MFRRRIQLGLLHVALTITLLPINSTLNRVMIKELALSATLVAALASLPYLISPLQVSVGAFSDRHAIFGLRRTPFILLGLLMCVAGVVLAPQAAFNLAENFGRGLWSGALIFGLWGMGYNLAAVSYLSLASEASGKERGKTIAVMWFMMIVSIILTSIWLSRMVSPYSPAALVVAFRRIGLLALILGLIGLFRLEERLQGAERTRGEERLSWRAIWRSVWGNAQARTFFIYLTLLLTAILGQDILLEPYAAEAFDLTVRETTRITSIWGVFVLLALVVTGWLETRTSKKRLAALGGLLVLLGFGLLAAGGLAASSGMFYLGLMLLGSGTGMSTVSNLSLMLEMTVEGRVGLFIGAWGMSNAISRLIGSLLGAATRDLIRAFAGDSVAGYITVFALMTLMVGVTLLMLRRIDVRAFRQQAEESFPLAQRAAMATDF